MNPDGQFPGYSDSIRQSVTNPVQVDRVTESTELETDFPTAFIPRKLFLWILTRLAVSAIFVAILPTLIDLFLPILWAIEVWNLFTAICLLVVIFVYCSMHKSIVRMVFFCFAIPVLILQMVYLRSTFALLISATVATALIADNYAKQVLYLGTTSPFPRPDAKLVRSKWKSRLLAFSTARGLELYGLGLFFLFCVPWVIDAYVPKVAMMGTIIRIPAILISLAIIVCIPVILEVASALLFARKTLGIHCAWIGFKRSVKDWLAYNHFNLRSPGVLQSPVGTSHSRRIVTLALFGLWVAALTPFFSQNLALRESIADARINTYVKHVKAQEEAARKSQAELMAMISGRPSPGYSAPNGSVPPSVPIELPKESANAVAPRKLEPFQERMLQRMPPEEREEYLKTLQPVDKAKPEAKIEPKPTKSLPKQIEGKAQDILFDLNHPHATADYSRGENMQVVTMFTGLFFMIILPKLLVIVFSLLFPLSFAYLTSVRIASSLREQLESNPDSILSHENWDQLVNDVVNSSNKTEQQHVLLGVNAHDNAPVLVPTKLFEEHAHILGDSGSGKTSMGISLILHQLIRQPDCSIVVIDLKGDDMALFEGTRVDAQSAGKSFRWFTNELGRSTYAFNPLDQAYFHSLSLYQKTDVVTAALGLQYGTDYGRGYFSDANSDYLYRTLQAHPTIRSFDHLARILPSGFGVENVTYDMRKAASHIVSISQRLAATEALNVSEQQSPSPEVYANRIDFSEIFRTPQVLFLSLPSTLGTASSAEIARIALYSIIGSARLTPEPQRKQVFVVIDEFQRIIANNLELIMQTARSMRVGLILANQSMLDLKKADTDLTPAVRSNTRYKQIFAASNIDELKEVVDASGESLIYQKSFSGELGRAFFCLGSPASGIFRLLANVV